MLQVITGNTILMGIHDIELKYTPFYDKHHRILHILLKQLKKKKLINSDEMHILETYV